VEGRPRRDPAWSGRPRAAPGQMPASPCPSGFRGVSCSARPAEVSAPQGPGERARPVPPTPPALCKPQTPAGGREQAAAAHSQAALGAMLRPPHHLQRFGRSRGAAGGSAAPKSRSPTFGLVLIFQSSILQFKSLCSVKYFSISLNILQRIP